MNAKENICYVVNQSKVLSEELDGETIIINLETGNYYSMNKAGSALWARLVSKQAYQKICDELSAHCKSDIGVFKKSVEDAITLLKNDGLVTEGKSTGESGDTTFETSEKFEPVSIVRYDDMQEMLLADPIHDVDKTGWPGVKPKKK